MNSESSTIESSSYTHLEASGAPVHELDAALGLDGGDGGVHVLGHHVTTVEHAAGHVLAYNRGQGCGSGRFLNTDPDSA